MAKKSGAQKVAVDWVGGIVTLPSFITGEGEPYQPELLLWITSQGQIVGMDTARPGELQGLIVQHFLKSSRQPMMGPPHVPTTVRIASETLAAALRAELGDEVEVFCAPTPEIDAVVAAMTQQMADEGAPATTYLAPGLDAAAMAAFFEAAAGLVEAKPWSIAIDEENLLLVTCEALGLRDAVICFMGAPGQAFGLVLFHDLAGYEVFVDAAMAIEAGEPPQVPPHFAINFERGDALNSDLRDEIEARSWRVAAPDAYPWLTAMGADATGRPPTADELAQAEVLALAVAQALDDRAALMRAWMGTGAFARTLTVQAHRGAFDVTMRAIGGAEIVEHAQRTAAAPRPARPADAAAGHARKTKRKAERSARKKSR